MASSAISFSHKRSYNSVTETVDQSGYSNRALGVANVRPGLGGLGSAAYFKKKHFLEIRHIEQYNSKELTVVMWVHLRRTWSTGNREVDSQRSSAHC
jgi:hypothetical protein